MKKTMSQAIAICAAAMALTACAAFDAAHIEGQKQDAGKYRQYSDVELQKQVAVEACFNKASTDNQIAICALMGTATGMASTFGGRPTATTVAPTTAQALGATVEAVAPYGAAVGIARSVAKVQSKDPVIVQQPAPLVVEPTVVTVPATAP